MLVLVQEMKELNFRQLMDVYEEGNLENGRQMYPYDTDGQRLLYAEQGFYQYLAECFFPTEGAVYALWVSGNRYVSALRLEPYQDGLLIEALETMPTHRNKGYAKALISSVLGAFPGQKLYSHIGKKNGASVRVHEACGFQKILNHAVYADGSVLQNCSTFCCFHGEKPEEIKKA